MMVCNCMGISDRAIRAALDRMRAITPAGIFRAPGRRGLRRLHAAVDGHHAQLRNAWRSGQPAPAATTRQQGEGMKGDPGVIDHLNSAVRSQLALFGTPGEERHGLRNALPADQAE